MNEQLSKLIMSSCDIPPMSLVASSVMRATMDLSCDAARLQRIISSDPGLVTKILKIANSAFYGLPRKVSNLSTAIIVLGYTTIRNLVISVSSKTLFGQHSWMEQLMWEHSLSVSVASHIIARHVGGSNIEDVFISGLLHDIGKTVLSKYAPIEYGFVMEKGYEDDSIYSRTEKELFGFSHEDVGALLAKKWNLPRELELTIQLHHCRHIPSALKGTSVFKLVNVIKLADALCYWLNPTSVINEGIFKEVIARPMSELKLNPAWLRSCIADIENSLEKEKNAINF